MWTLDIIDVSVCSDERVGNAKYGSQTMAYHRKRLRQRMKQRFSQTCTYFSVEECLELLSVLLQVHPHALLLPFVLCAFVDLSMIPSVSLRILISQTLRCIVVNDLRLRRLRPREGSGHMLEAFVSKGRRQPTSF